MIQLTPPWKCDHCGQSIESVEDGWLEWLTTKDEASDRRMHSGLRLVHCHSASPIEGGKCTYDGQAEFRRNKAIQLDLPLREMEGGSGLMRLLEFLSEDSFGCREEVLEMIKRLYIPRYDQVRNSLEAAAGEAYDQRTKMMYPHQHQIDAVAEWIDSEQ